MDLADQSCIPCRGGVPALAPSRIEQLLRQLAGRWALNSNGHLECSYEFSNFVDAMNFANGVGDIANAENHHPDLHVGWGRCKVEIWTHKISGLTDSDFYFAAKVERAFQQLD